MNLKADMPEVIALSKKVSIAQNRVVTEFNEVSSGIDDLVNMDNFSGEAAVSAKGYFENVHQTAIFAFQQLMIDIDDNFQGHIDKFHSNVDSSSNARVEKDYLEEVKEKIKTPFESFEETNDGVVSTIEDISDIVVVTKPVMTIPRMVKDSIVELIEKLTANFETYTTLKNEQVKEMLHHVKELMAEIQTYKGEDRFKNADKSELVDPLREIMMDEGGIFGSLLDKIANDEPLQPKEQSLLYYFFQNVILTDETKREIDEVTENMSEENIDQLKDRLNEKVVFSRGTLEREIAIIQAYLYLGEKRPGQTEILTNDRSKLEAYLMLLKDYDKTMSDGKVVIVDRLEYESERNDISGHFIFSALQTEDYDEKTEDLMSKQQFRDWIFDPDNPIVNKYSLSEISFFIGTDATNDKVGDEIADLKNKESTFTVDFITKKVIGKVISEAASALKIGELYGIAKDVSEHNEEYKELKRDLTVKEGMEAAGRLDMEFGINETREVPGSRKPDVGAIQLAPTDKTFEILDRWEKVNEIHPQIEFPEEVIRSQDWYGVSEKLTEIKKEYGEDVSNYIRDEVLREGETVEDITMK